MYAIGCSNALVQVLITPLVDKGLRKLGCPPPRVLYESEDVGTIRNWDVLAAAIGYAWGMTWLYMAVTVPHSDQYAFFLDYPKHFGNLHVHRLSGNDPAEQHPSGVDPVGGSLCLRYFLRVCHAVHL